MPNDDDLDLDDGVEDEPEPPPIAAKPNGKMKGKPRPPPLGAGKPTQFSRTSNEGSDVWAELVAWLPTAGLTPYDVYCQIKRIEPPAPGGGVFTMGRIPGQAIAGSDSLPPGVAIWDYMVRNIHLTTIATPGKYDIEFRRTSTGEIITKARMDLPDRQTCLAMLAADEAAQGAMGGPGLGSPPRQPAPAPQVPPQPTHAAPPWWAQQTPPPFAFGGPPAPAPAADPMMMQMFGSMFSEMMSAMREGRQPVMPVMPPAGVAAPINEEALAQRVTANVLMALKQAGIGAQPPPPAVAAPAPTPLADGGLGAMVNDLAFGLVRSIIKKTGAAMEENITSAMGMGAPPAAEGDEETPAPAEPTKPEDVLPWQAADTGAKWQDGRPVHFAKNKETGNIDPMGVLMTNPVIGEKAMTIATGIGEAIQEGIKRFTQPPPQPGQAHVVKQIPTAAQDANPTPGEGEGGWGS